MSPLHQMTETIFSLQGAFTLTILIPITYGLATGVRTAASRLFRKISRGTSFIMGMTSAGAVLLGLLMAWTFTPLSLVVPFGTLLDLFYNALTGFAHLVPESGIKPEEVQPWLHDLIKLLGSTVIGAIVLFATATTAGSGSLTDKANSLRSLIQPKPQTENVR